MLLRKDSTLNLMASYIPTYLHNRQPKINPDRQTQIQFVNYQPQQINARSSPPALLKNALTLRFPFLFQLLKDSQLWIIAGRVSPIRCRRRHFNHPTSSSNYPKTIVTPISALTLLQRSPPLLTPIIIASSCCCNRSALSALLQTS